MKLPEVIELLRAEVNDRPNWRVAVLARPKDDKTQERSEIVEYPIFDIFVDDDDDEINLLTDEGANNPRGPAEALTLEGLLGRLEDLMPTCRNCSVFSGSAFESLNERWDVRYDAPLVGVAKNGQDEVFGFLQWPLEQWESTV